MEQNFTVTGMTCGHCVHAVTTEIGKLPGVRSVAVDLPAGRVTVDADRALDPAAVANAVDEAGYALASAEGAAP
jgi:copper ion binding protein